MHRIVIKNCKKKKIEKNHMDSKKSINSFDTEKKG